MNHQDHDAHVSATINYAYDAFNEAYLARDSDEGERLCALWTNCVINITRSPLGPLPGDAHANQDS